VVVYRLFGFLFDLDFPDLWSGLPRGGFLRWFPTPGLCFELFGPSFFGEFLAKSPGCVHLRDSCSRILLWNSSLEMFNLCHSRVGSSSIGSPYFRLPLLVGPYVLSGFRGVIVSRWLLFVHGDPWICLTVANLVSFRIAHWARASRSSYSSLLAPHGFCNSAIIPPRSSSPPVE